MPEVVDVIPLRERTRRAVQSELVDAALGLFVEFGFEVVTIEQIAAAAGMSKRSFFRYFASKDALVLGKYDRQGDAFAEALSARPPGEDAWESLRRMFDDVVDYLADPEKARRAAEVDRVINASESLRAGYLERMQRAQRCIVDVLTERSDERLGRFQASALVAAAFAALTVAHAHSVTDGVDLPDAVDEAMSAIGTAGSDLSSSV